MFRFTNARIVYLPVLTPDTIFLLCTCSLAPGDIGHSYGILLTLAWRLDQSNRISDVHPIVRYFCTVRLPLLESLALFLECAGLGLWSWSHTFQGAVCEVGKRANNCGHESVPLIVGAAADGDGSALASTVSRSRCQSRQGPNVELVSPASIAGTPAREKHDADHNDMRGCCAMPSLASSQDAESILFAIMMRFSPRNKLNAPGLGLRSVVWHRVRFPTVLQLEHRLVVFQPIFELSILRRSFLRLATATSGRRLPSKSYLRPTQRPSTTID